MPSTIPGTKISKYLLNEYLKISYFKIIAKKTIERMDQKTDLEISVFYVKLYINFKPIYFHNSTMNKPQVFQTTKSTKTIHL